MQLKLVTFDKVNCSVSTQLIELSPTATVEYRSLMTDEFSPLNDKIPSSISSDVVALVIQNSMESNIPVIKIDKHQGAYILDEGKTVELINNPADFDDLQIWTKYEDKWVKESLHSFVEEMRYRYSGHEYRAVRDGSDPNEEYTRKSSDSASVAWYRNTKGTSATWLPASQLEIGLHGNNPDYVFIECKAGVDPNKM